MIKYVKDIQENGECKQVGVGTDVEYYQSIGMVRKDVEQSEIDGCWYLTAKCPHYSDEEKLNNAKTAKLAELDSITSQFDSYKCDSMFVTSSVGGYRFNADIRSQTNLQGLISVLDDSQTTLYKDYDNEFRTLNKEQMQTIFNECILNGQNLYATKWKYQAQISACTTIEDVQSIEIKFEMMDFSD